MTSETDRAPLEDLDSRVRRWQSAGILSPEQSRQILQFEGSPVPEVTQSVPTTPPTRRLSLVADLVSYLGVVLVLASGGVFVSRLWHGLGLWGRVAVGIVAALVGFVGGQIVLRWNEEGTTRLGWFFWLLGTGGVAMSTAVVVDRVGGRQASWTLLVTGLAVLGVSVGLWRNLDRPLQFLSSVLGFALTVAGAVQFAHRAPSTLVVGAFVWTAGGVLGVLALKYVRPALLAILVAQGALFMGGMAMITSQGRPVGFVLGMLGAVAGVALGLSKRETPIVTVGIVSFFVFVLRVLSYYLRGPGTILVSFILGVALVGVVIWRATTSRSSNEREQGPNPWNSHGLRHRH